MARRTDCVGTTLIFLRTSAHVTITLERDGSGQVGHLGEETQNVLNGPGLIPDCLVGKVITLGGCPELSVTDDRRTDEQEN